MTAGGEPSLAVMSGCGTSSDPFILLTPCASSSMNSHLQLLRSGENVEGLASEVMPLSHTLYQALGWVLVF